MKYSASNVISKISLLSVSALCALMLNACTNPTGTAGTMNSSYKGTIHGIEVIDLDEQKYNTSTNALLGGIAGAVIGNLFTKNSTGTLVGAAAGAATGGLGSAGLNRSEGLRLSISSENGDVLVDVPFNCNYKVGQKIRIVGSGNSGAQVQYYSNGSYHTATSQKTSACPTTYNKFKRGVGDFSEE